MIRGTRYAVSLPCAGPAGLMRVAARCARVAALGAPMLVLAALAQAGLVIWVALWMTPRRNRRLVGLSRGGGPDLALDADIAAREQPVVRRPDGCIGGNDDRPACRWLTRLDLWQGSGAASDFQATGGPS